ncbi:MAG: hypothetical protein KAJ48_01230, partial [Elusimicrobiales bacterium]|nr:hypothetical protein [Elusimicrobiales bacterium]
MVEEIKSEKLRINQVEDEVNNMIDEFTENPELIGNLYEEGKTLMEETKKSFTDKDIKIYIAKELVSRNPGHENATEKDDDFFKEMYKKIGYYKITAAIHAYKDAQYPDNAEDEVEEVKTKTPDN